MTYHSFNWLKWIKNGTFLQVFLRLISLIHSFALLLMNSKWKCGAMRSTQWANQLAFSRLSETIDLICLRSFCLMIMRSKNRYKNEWLIGHFIQVHDQRSFCHHWLLSHKSEVRTFETLINVKVKKISKCSTVGLPYWCKICSNFLQRDANSFRSIQETCSEPNVNVRTIKDCFIYNCNCNQNILIHHVPPKCIKRWFFQFLFFM